MLSKSMVNRLLFPMLLEFPLREIVPEISAVNCAGLSATLGSVKVIFKIKSVLKFSTQLLPLHTVRVNCPRSVRLVEPGPGATSTFAKLPLV